MDRCKFCVFGFVPQFGVCGLPDSPIKPLKQTETERCGAGCLSGFALDSPLQAPCSNCVFFPSGLLERPITVSLFSALCSDIERLVLRGFATTKPINGGNSGHDFV